MKTLPQTVKFMRERKGLSAAKLSRLAGYSASYVTKLEHGELEPSISAFATLAEILDFSDQEILFTVKKAGEESDK